MSSHLPPFSAAQLLRKLKSLPEVNSYIVGFSGGADSTALLLLLEEAFPCIEAVHLNHGLRGDAAAADEDWCRNFCRERGIPYVSVALNVPAKRCLGEGIEAAGRRLRLAYWRDTTNSECAVALGHHADDCIEDLLLRATRGANSGGLTPMRPRRCRTRLRRVCSRRIRGLWRCRPKFAGP